MAVFESSKLHFSRRLSHTQCVAY